MQVEDKGSGFLGSGNRIRGDKYGRREGKRCIVLVDSERS